MTQPNPNCTYCDSQEEVTNFSQKPIRAHLNRRMMKLCLSLKDYAIVIIQRKSVGKGVEGRGEGKIHEPKELYHKKNKL